MKPFIWAHRGASGYEAENTMEAFEKALSQKADGIELDVQMTRDEKLVIIHDEMVDRTSNGNGWVKDFSLEEIKKLDFGIHSNNQTKREIPTLEEALDFISTTELRLNIELKNGVVFYYGMEEKVLQAVKEKNLLDRVLFSSFNHKSMVRIKKMEPSVKTGFLFADGVIGMPEYTLRHGGDSLHPALYNLQIPELISEAREFNIPLHVWTVNEEEHLDLACKMGIAGIFTNYPDIARRIVDSYGD